MASSSLLPSAFLGLLLLLSSSTSSTGAEEAAAVLTLDVGNLSEAIAAHQFIVVNFYAPWCYWSNKLAPEYEKAASILRNHDPPIVLAKIDDTASSKNNKDCREKYRVLGYPTIMFLRNGGSTVQEYVGARDAESIVQYLKKQVGPPASAEMRSAEDAASLITYGNGKGMVTDGTLEPYRESDPIPALNDHPVKSLQTIFMVSFSILLRKFCLS